MLKLMKKTIVYLISIGIAFALGILIINYYVLKTGAIYYAI